MRGSSPAARAHGVRQSFHRREGDASGHRYLGSIPGGQFPGGAIQSFRTLSGNDARQVLELVRQVFRRSNTTLTSPDEFIFTEEHEREYFGPRRLLTVVELYD